MQQNLIFTNQSSKLSDKSPPMFKVILRYVFSYFHIITWALFKPKINDLKIKLSFTMLNDQLLSKTYFTYNVNIYATTAVQPRCPVTVSAILSLSSHPWHSAKWLKLPVMECIVIKKNGQQDRSIPSSCSRSSSSSSSIFAFPSSSTDPG